MPRYLHLLFLAVAGIFFFGCSHPTEGLNTAERMMETAPDSALQILQHVNVHRLSTSSDKALYALLMSQALDKNDIKVESDSLISIASNYYGTKDPLHAAYSWFYMARCANNRGNAKVQADALLKAQEFAERTENYKLRGLVYGDKGTMYRTQGQIDSSIYYFKRSNQSFKKVNECRNCIINSLNIGDEYLLESRFDSVISYFHLAENLAKKINDTILNSSIYRNLGTVYFQQKKFNLALHYFKKAPLTHISIYDSNKWYLLADVYIKLNKTDSASFYLKKVKVLQEMAPDYYRLWQKLYEKEGNLKKALYYATKITNATDSLYKRRLDVSFAGLEKKYNYQSLQLSNQGLEIKNKQNGILLLIALLVLSTLSILFLFLRFRVRTHQLETQKQLVLHEKALVEKERETVEKEKENSALLQKQLKMHEILLLNVEQYRKNSVKRPETATSGIKTLENPTFYQELIACMDVQYRDISIRLSLKFPELTERDILICCLLLANFDTGMIATILDIKNDSIRIHRTRLRKKLGLQNSENLTDYLRRF